MKSSQFLQIISNSDVIPNPLIFIKLMKLSSEGSIKIFIEKSHRAKEMLGCQCNGSCYGCILSWNNRWINRIIIGGEIMKNIEDKGDLDEAYSMLGGGCGNIFNMTQFDLHYKDFSLLLEMKKLIDEYDINT